MAVDKEAIKFIQKYGAKNPAGAQWKEDEGHAPDRSPNAVAFKLPSDASHNSRTAWPPSEQRYVCFV